MSLRQVIHSGPAKANELFAKLAETGDGAVKTRERLFAELKAELELLAGLEETHLFPALRKRPETKALAADALADNKQVRALLAELEPMPKEGQDFPAKLTELRKAFQQHVRDEKRELLPAVAKALSEEEAQTVAEKIAAGKADAEEAQREEAERQRAEARRSASASRPRRSRPSAKRSSGSEPEPERSEASRAAASREPSRPGVSRPSAKRSSGSEPRPSVSARKPSRPGVSRPSAGRSRLRSGAPGRRRRP